jgi:flagellar hook-length control protein FliK
MAEIQAALPAKFMQVAGANKAGNKVEAGDGGNPAAFFGVLKAQLSKPEAAGDTLALEVKPLNLKKSLLDAAAEPAATPNEAALSPPLVSEPARDAAVASAALLASGAAAKDAVVLAQDADADPVMTGMADEKAAKAVAATKTEAQLKASPALKATASLAANAAETGQVLPALSSGQAGPSVLSDEVVSEVKFEPAMAVDQAPLSGARSEVGVASSNALTHPFEQTLRQAEIKVNAAIEAPLRSAAFATELGDKVVWLAGRQGQFADLSLNPPQMGALEVRLTVSGGETSAQFFSPNPVVRDAIDAALPKLREMMAQAGINLGETGVRDQAFGRRESQQMPGQTAGAQDAQIIINQAAMTGIGVARSGGLGLVDLYI